MWPSFGRTPLILPGNPALSQEAMHRTLSPVRAFGGIAVAVGAAVVVSVLYLRSGNEPEAPATQFATGVTAAPAGTGGVRPAPIAVPSPTTAPPQTPVAAQPVAAQPAASSTSGTSSEPKPPTIAGPDVRSVVVPVKTVETPRATTETARPAAPPAVPVARPPAAVAKAVPVLRLVPLFFDSLRTGDLLQLRWTVQDSATGVALPANLEFSSTDASIASVDRRIGTVSAHKPGRVRIILDAGAAGHTDVTLTVQPRQSAAMPPAAPATARSSAREPVRRTRETRTAAPSAASTTATPTPAALTLPDVNLSIGGASAVRATQQLSAASELSQSARATASRTAAARPRP